MKTRFFIDIETEQKLNNEIQMELLVEIRNTVHFLRKRFPESKITVTKELTNEDIMESLRGEPTPTINYPQTNSQTREQCFYYDKAQGKHKCTNDLVKSTHCSGVCKFYYPKKSKK